MCSAKELSHNMDKLSLALRETNAVAVETQLEMRELSSGLRIWKETKCAAHDKSIETLNRDVAEAKRLSDKSAMKAAMAATGVFILFNAAIAVTVATQF